MDKNPAGNLLKSNAAMRERLRPRRNSLLRYFLFDAPWKGVTFFRFFFFGHECRHYVELNVKINVELDIKINVKSVRY